MVGYLALVVFFVCMGISASRHSKSLAPESVAVDAAPAMPSLSITGKLPKKKGLGLPNPTKTMKVVRSSDAENHEPDSILEANKPVAATDGGVEMSKPADVKQGCPSQLDAEFCLRAAVHENCCPHPRLRLLQVIAPAEGAPQSECLKT